MVTAKLFRSRFAYRIFILFISAAIVPLLLLAFITYHQVSRQLITSSQERLHRNAVSLGMTIIERCITAEHEIELASLYFDPGKGLKAGASILDEYFSDAAVIATDKTFYVRLIGDGKDWPEVSGSRESSLSSGKTVLFTHKTSPAASSIFMYRKMQAGPHKDLIFMARIRPEFLLGINPEHEEPFGSIGVCIAEKRNLVFTTLPRIDSDIMLKKLNSSGMRENMLSGRLGSDYLMSGAPVFLKSRFDAPTWSLILTEPTSMVFSPVKSFKTTFILIIALAFAIVTLLCVRQIRRYLMPLDQLRKGTVDIAQGNFESKVVIQSGDEFENLAQSFNAMGSRIDQQFKALNTMSDIDRAILSELDFAKIIDTFVKRINDVCPCDAAGVSFRYKSSDEKWITHCRTLPSDGSEQEVYTLNSDDLGMLKGEPECLVLEQGSYPPQYLAPLARKGLTSFLVMPVILNADLMAIVFLGGKGSDFLDKEYQLRARQIADRVAVALANAYLINELSTLNWGTLTALARVVDAKSPWTAGHSERVAALALRIGNVMGLNPHQLDILNKAGMLHDIGKVSTPRSILDKQGKLTDEEYAVIQKHPERGTLILEPIASYAEMIPLVREHHERFDGKGYPNGLSGSDISLGARILAVADTFDAMTSDRPYRSGLNTSFVITEIRKEAGHQFDPEVIEAFCKVMSAEENMKESA